MNWRIRRQIDIGSREHTGWLPATASTPHRTESNFVDVWIEETPEGVFLFTRGVETISDTWHQSLDDAFAQAEFEFGISHAEWSLEEQA